MNKVRVTAYTTVRFWVLYRFLALSQANALVVSVGRTHPRMGPPHLYLERRLEGTPIVDGNPGKLLKWDVWFTEDALFATFRAVILFVGLNVYIIYYTVDLENIFT